MESCREILAIYLESGIQYSAVLCTEMSMGGCVHSLAGRTRGQKPFNASLCFCLCELSIDLSLCLK